jgi:hypothetical protein
VVIGKSFVVIGGRFIHTAYRRHCGRVTDCKERDGIQRGKAEGEASTGAREARLPLLMRGYVRLAASFERAPAETQADCRIRRQLRAGDGREGEMNMEERIREYIRKQMEQKESYIAHYLSETGLKADEIILVESRSKDGLRIEWHCEPKTEKSPDIRALYWNADL